MKMKRLKLGSLILLIALVLPFIFASCDNSSKQNLDESETTSEIVDLVPHLGKADYTGKTLIVLATNKSSTYGASQISPEELTTEPVNDAFYERNQLLKREFGFDIKCIYNDGYEKLEEQVRTDLGAGLNEYDIVAAGVQSLAFLAKDGYFYDLYQLPKSKLQLDKDWWDTNIIADLTIANKLFFATGDIFVNDDEYTSVTYFNKTLVEENNLGNPYDLAKDGKWTLDVMYEMIKKVVKEDGDGVMNVTGKDVWGMVSHSFDAYKYVVGCNNPQVYKNEETDIPYLAMTEPQAITSFNKVFDIFTDKARVAYTEQYYRWNDPQAGTVIKNFYDGKALFFAGRIDAVSSESMKTSTIKYGILPVPKFDEAQERYTSVVDPYHFYCLSVVNNAKDIEFSTFAIEAMAYLSQKMVTPEYYNRTLQLKRFDDQDSAEMLDIIFSNRIADLSIIFDWDDCIQYYNQLLASNSKDIISFIDARKEVFNTEMNATLEAINNK